MHAHKARIVVVVLSLAPPIPALWASLPFLAQTMKTNTPPARAFEQVARSDDETGIRVRMKNIVDRLLKLQDHYARTLALIRVAGLIWSEDESSARGLFLEAIDELTAVIKEDDRQQQLNQQERLSLHRELIAHLAGRDAALEKVAEALLPDTASRANRPDLLLDFASKLSDSDPRRAAELARRSLESGATRRLLWILRRMQRVDEAAANSLFLDAVTRLTIDRTVDANDLLLFGTFVFRPIIEHMDAAVSGDLVQMVAIGGVLTYNLSATRLAAPEAVARKYLEAALAILARTPSDPRQKAAYYVAAFQLLPRFREQAPDLAPALSSVLDSLTADVPAALTQATTYSILAQSRLTGVRSLDEALREVDAVPEGDHRDGRALDLGHDFYTLGDSSGAAAIFRRVANPGARSQLETLMKFSEAVKLLERGQVHLAEEQAGKLDSGIERATLYIGIARAFMREGWTSRAVEFIHAGVRDARRLDDPRRCAILLSAAAELSDLDRIAANGVLIEAIKAFNSDSPESLARVQWFQRIQLKLARQDFPLKIRGLELGFHQALPVLLKADIDTTMTAVMGLKSERALGEALTALAAALLHFSPKEEIDNET